MGTLSDLEGVRKKFTDCEFFGNTKDIYRIIKRGNAASTAKDHGAIDVYKDDNGCIRVSKHRNLCTIGHQVYPDIKSALPLIKVWLLDIE